MDVRPMDIDIEGDGMVIDMNDGMKSFMTPATAATTAPLSEEEEARQAIDALRGDDVAGRVAAANRLEAVASALGKERTREELLPFLTDGVDDEDEVLLALATKLGNLVDYVGGPEHAHTLLPPLELLLTVEEASVRDAASKSTRAVADVLPESSFRDRYAAMLERLAKKEWFTARMSAAGLISSAYEKLTTEQRSNSIGHFAQLCRDDTPMVRRVAAQHLGSMLSNVVEHSGRASLDENQNGQAAISLIPLYEGLASTEQPDSVRLQTTENCVAFGRVMSNILAAEPDGLLDNEIALLKRLLPLVVATIDDRSWRVRWTAASKFSGVIRAFDALPGVMDSLVPAYEKLLQDPEAEVRTAATFNLAEVALSTARVPLPSPHGRPSADEIGAAYTGPRISVAERLVKRVTLLTEDDSEHVRAALAMVATELAPNLGREATITHLVPPVLLLLRDAASEVRLNLISSLGALNEVIGVDLLSQSLLPAILDLAQDNKWRIRLAIIQHIPLLARQLGKDFFTDRLSAPCVAWLGDDISTIREAAAENLKEVTAVFGTEWTVQHLLPPVKNICYHESYLRRLTALQAFSRMATKMDPDIATTDLLPTILEMSQDPVPNIRFNVAKELADLAPVCGKEVCDTQIRPVLGMLITDPDRDVRFYAERTLQVLQDLNS